MFKRLIAGVLLVGLLMGMQPATSGAAMNGVYWDNLLMVKGQIGKIKVIKPINLWKRVGDKLVFERVLKPNEQYRVYRYDNKFGGQYGLGGGYYITKMAGYVEYKTPSKRKLAELDAFYPITNKVKTNLSVGKVTSQETKKVAPGVTETEIEVDSNRGKQQIYMLDFAPGTENMEIQTVLSNDTMFGLETVSSQAKNNSAEGNRVVGGVNGDYFDKDGSPMDLMVQNGEIIATSRTPLSDLAVFGVKANGQAVIGSPTLSLSVKVNGASTYTIDSINRTRSANHLVLYTPHFAKTTRTNALGTEVILTNLNGKVSGNGTLTAIVQDVVKGVGDAPLATGTLVLSGHHMASEFLQTIKPGDQIEITSAFTDAKWHDVVEALGGRYRLVNNGSVVKWDIAGAHPRTAIGIKADGTVFTVVIDGRQSNYSVGMTLSEIASLMKDLGAVDAITFDGGGSSTMVTRQPGDENVSVINQPSDGRERSVANSLFFISKWLTGPLDRLILSPSDITVFAGATYHGLGVSAKGVDYAYNPVAVTNPVTYTSPIFTVNQNNTYKVTTQVGTSVLTAKSGSVYGAAKVTVVNKLDRIKMEQAEVIVIPNGTIQLNPQGIYGGKTVVTDPTVFKWEVVTKDFGTVDKNGVFKAGAKTGAGTIKVTAGGVEGTATVIIGDPTSLVLEGFENGFGNWDATGVRDVSTVIADTTDKAFVKTGSHSLKLNYDFTGTTGTSGAYAAVNTPIKIVGQPKKIGMWVYGDGKGHWLRMQLKDGQNKEIQLDFTKNLDWTGWKYVEAAIPAGVTLPLVIDIPIRYMETEDSNKNSGTIYIDDIQAVY
ncbi:phosphodiester glycosidase family protein [Fredinandcohnia humi]